MNRRYLLLVLVCLLVLVLPVCAGWYDTNWNYRKEITVNNAGSALADYQIQFTVNRSSGSDSGSTVYLNGKCQDDYDDIRFTKADGTTPLDYWIESSTSTVATIWVEFDSLPNGNTQAYLYYGNAGASAVSSGADTFPFFDDFPGSSLDAGKWTGGTGVTVSGSVCTVAATDSTIRTLISVGGVGNNMIVQARMKTTHYNSISGMEAMVLQASGDWNNYIGVFPCNEYGVNNKYVNIFSGTAATAAMSGYSADTWQNITLKRANDRSKWYVNDANEVVISTGYPTGSLPINFHARGAGYNTFIDWIFTRQYVATEPTITAWGRETPNNVELYPSFSALPLSGNVPLLVTFADSSTSVNATINTWQWSFGDGSGNSTQQNPQHQYVTSGLYDVILTITNTSFSLTNSTKKTGYINVTVNPDAPNADFTVTETCGETTDTFYFIDFSTGGGLYAWNWSFGDGSYSELRNPTHQYAGNGTYDVNLTVWGAYGVDSLLRSNLITIPCGAPTPTPTPTGTGTPTPTGTPGGNITEGNITYIYAPDQDYVPFPIWLAIVVVTIALFGHSIIFLRNSDLTAMMAAVFAFISAWLSNMIGFIEVQVTYVSEEILISPVIQAVHPPWLVYTMLLFALVSVVNIFAAIYKVYLKPTPWNEIYNRKLPKWRNR